MLKFRPNAPVHGGSIALLDCLFRHHSKLHSPLQGSLNLTLHKSQVSVHQGSPLMHESFPESSVRTGRVLGLLASFLCIRGLPWNICVHSDLEPNRPLVGTTRSPAHLLINQLCPPSKSTPLHRELKWN